MNHACSSSTVFRFWFWFRRWLCSDRGPLVEAGGPTYAFIMCIDISIVPSRFVSASHTPQGAGGPFCILDIRYSCDWYSSIWCCLHTGQDQGFGNWLLRAYFAQSIDSSSVNGGSPRDIFLCWVFGRPLLYS